MQKRFYPFAKNVKHGLFTEILENTLEKRHLLYPVTHLLSNICCSLSTFENFFVSHTYLSWETG